MLPYNHLKLTVKNLLYQLDFPSASAPALTVYLPQGKASFDGSLVPSFVYESTKGGRKSGFWWTLTPDC